MRIGEKWTDTYQFYFKRNQNEKMFVLVVLLIFNRKSPAVERRLREA